MPKEEIIGGLRNAIDRGDSLSKAVQTFINAGYNPAEVKAAADLLEKGATGILTTAPKETRKLPPLPEKSGKPLPKMPSTKDAKPKKGKTGLIIFLVVILLIIIGAVVFILL